MYSHCIDVCDYVCVGVFVRMCNAVNNVFHRSAVCRLCGFAKVARAEISHNTIRVRASHSHRSVGIEATKQRSVLSELSPSQLHCTKGEKRYVTHVMCGVYVWYVHNSNGLIFLREIASATSDRDDVAL